MIEMPFLTKNVSLIMGLLAALHLSACSPLSLGTTVVGVTGLTAFEERSVERNLQDKKIYFVLYNALNEQLPKGSFNITVLVYEGEVMLVGYVDEEVENRVITIAESTEGVQRVIKHFYAMPLDSATYASDYTIRLEVSSKLLFEQAIRAVNYVIRVYDGRVYIMGSSRSSQEFAQLRQVIANISGVRGIITNVRVKPPVLSNISQE